MTEIQKSTRNNLLAKIAKNGGELCPASAAKIVGGDFDEWHKHNRDLPIAKLDGKIVFRTSRGGRLMQAQDTNGIGGRETART